MRLLMIFLLGVLCCNMAMAQSTAKFTAHELKLPPELRDPDNQFSGLCISGKSLFLLSECRLQEAAEAKIYRIKNSDLDRQLRDSNYKLPFTKLHIYHLDDLREKINAAGQLYEGLEAIIIDKNDIYFSVETATRSTNCYLLKGRLNDTSVALDKNFLLAMPKPVAANGDHIYNAGFEAVTKMKHDIFAFYEYNYFPAGNNVYRFDKNSIAQKAGPTLIATEKIPFRITDIIPVGKNRYTAINFFYKGEGKDTVYRTPADDSLNNRLIVKNGRYESYCRLVDITLTPKGFTWKPLWKFPGDYNDYNWEGLAAYKNGYFMINDKYTPARPYFTNLVYLEREK